LKFKPQWKLNFAVFLDIPLNIINLLKVNVAWQARLKGYGDSFVINLVIQALVHVWIENEKLSLRERSKDTIDRIID
jgi:hypothetical protein